MEVLAWLEERSFEWDMYVDLPASSVRYCFRTLADATAFNSGSCMRRKGELSPAAIDRGWPYQVALPTRASANGGSVVDKASGCQSGGALYHRIG
jgi:hypothetical protein